MRKITDAEVISPVQTQNGFVFMSPKETDGEKMVVTYKIFEFGSEEIMPVTRSVYLLNKFNMNFESFQGNFKKYINAQLITLPFKRQLVVYPSGNAEIYDNFSSVTEEHDFCYNDEPPAYIYGGDDCVWISYTENACVIKYDNKRFLQEFRIGGNGSSTFSSPSGIYADDKRLLVCDGVKIVSLDLKEFEITDYCVFDKKVKNFFMYKTDGIAFLEDGAYIL